MYCIKDGADYHVYLANHVSLHIPGAPSDMLSQHDSLEFYRVPSLHRRFNTAFKMKRMYKRREGNGHDGFVQFSKAKTVIYTRPNIFQGFITC